jgi:hypothetical protein
VFVLAGFMLHLQAETDEVLYPTAQRIFFWGLLVGGALAILSSRSHNSPGVVQGVVQLVFGVGIALALSAIGQLQAKTVAWSLYAVSVFFGLLAWWTIRNVSVASAVSGFSVESGRGTTPAAGDVSRPDRWQEGSARRIAPAHEKVHGPQPQRAGRSKRLSSYLLVTLDLVGLLIFVCAAVAMWTDRPRRVSPDVTFFVAFATVGPWMLGLMLFGWIAEVRPCWMLGLATLVPFFLLTIAGAIDASTPFVLSALAGLAVAAFAVETLRRLRKQPPSAS